MTGSHGFVGTNLIEALSPEHEIIRWDARVDKVLSKVDAVIHLAGLAHDTKNVNKPERYFEVNTELTKKLFDRFLASGAKKFVFFSSIKAQDGDTAYAESKRLAEEYILSKLPSDREAYILRPCMIHGKGVKGNLPLLFKFVKKGLPWPLAAFENKRSYASMGNVIYIINRLLCTDVESGIYNICDDEPVPTNDLIEIICQCLGLKARKWRIPKGVIQVMARVGDWMKLPLNSERLKKLTENYEVSNSQIREVLGINSLPIKAKDGLLSTIESLKTA